MTSSASTRRVNDIFLGPLERPALQWLGQRMPGWVSPDVLTLLGFFASLFVGVSYWLTQVSPFFLWLASFGLVLNWFGDSLDGTVARLRHIERPRYGYFLDHSLDVLGGFFIGVGVGLSPYVDFGYAMVGLLGYLLMSVSIHLRLFAEGVFTMSYAGIGTTEIRLFLILVNTIVFFAGNPHVDLPLGRLTLYDLCALVMGLVLIGAFIVVTWKVALRLRDAEDPARRP